MLLIFPCSRSWWHIAMLLRFPCSCSWTALLAVGSWKIYFRLRFLVTRCYNRGFQCCWSWMARLAIITSRRRSGWHVVMHAVDVRSAAVLSAKDSCQRRASWRKRVRQWSVVYGQWYQKSINSEGAMEASVGASVTKKEEKKILPSLIYFVSDMRIRQLNFSSRRYSHLE